MIIAQISDTHITINAPDADQRMRDFALTVADINALDPAPDAIVHSGDIVHGGKPDEYARVAAILANARAPVYLVPGNRDDKANLRAAFPASGYLTPVSGFADSDFIDYAIEDYPVRLIAFDTASSASNKGNFGPERAGRLARLIGAETTKPIAVFMHHPPFEVTVGPDRLHFQAPEMVTQLGQILLKSGRVIAVFSGHVHRACEGRIGNIRAMVAPCTATTRRYGDYPPRMQQRPVYQLHRYDPTWGFVSETRIVAADPAGYA